MMTNAKSTKKALMLSILSLVLCFSMLIGTTFAWFTDSVTSANNIIKSGNLDIEFEYWNGEKWVDVEGKSDILTNTLWEPGVTEVAYLRVKNAGSLALKYQLGINIVSEFAGTNVAGETFLLSDYIYYDVVKDQAPSFADRDAAMEKTTEQTLISVDYADADTLAAGADYVYYAFIVYMPTSVGNVANHNGVNVPEINLGINIFATQMTYEKDSYNEKYDEGAVVVATAAEAQAALDNAVPGATIYLMPYVDYGTLYIRPVEGNANTIADCDYSNYKKERLRKVEDLTIIGATGATIDNIQIVTGNQNNVWYYVDITNLVIDSVEFSSDTPIYPARSYSSPIFVSLGSTRIDGLTVKNCVQYGNNTQNFVYFNDVQASNSTFETYAKNVVITGNTVSNVQRLCELRETENVTITNNTITNTKQHAILLPVNSGKSYSGNVTISGNVSNLNGDRFVRMAGAGDATVTITNNTITNYYGGDADYIKVTDSTGTVTNEFNTITVANDIKFVSTPDELVSAFDTIANKDVIYIAADLDMTGKTLNPVTGNKGFTMLGNGYTISNLNSTAQGLFVANSGSASYTFDSVVLKNCSVNSVTNYGALFVGDGDTSDAITITNCDVINCTVKSAKYAAAFVGYTAGYNKQNDGPVYSDVIVVDCSVIGGSITGGGSVGAAIGHSGGNDDTTTTITNLKVEGVAINGEDAVHTGIVVGTANVGDTIINNATYNNVTGNYNTEHALYGRFVPGTTGTLVIDGTAV